MNKSLQIPSDYREKIQRRTRILCTIGPKSSGKDTLKKMMIAGMDAARLNFSHGELEGHKKTIQTIRDVAHELNRSFCILMDLQGPKIRVGKLKDGKFTVEAGETFKICVKKGFIGDKEKISCSYDGLIKDCRIGKFIFVDDGKIQLEVIRKFEEEIEVKTIVGGVIREHKGINLPNIPISAPCLTEKDKKDLQFGLAQHVDIVCLSFVRNPQDILDCHALMEDKEFNPSGHFCPIIAKIERQEAIDNLTEIIKTTSKFSLGGVMVARGDLAVETGYHRLAIIQKRVIRECIRFGVLAITATEMLNSMINNPLPSRAEVCDVSNAIFDNAGIVMLSNETAMGKYPIKSVQMMSQIARSSDQVYPEFAKPLKVGEFNYHDDYEMVLVGGKILAGKHRGIKCVVVYTRSGFTAQKFAAQRLQKPVFAMTNCIESYRRMSLVYGVCPIFVDDLKFSEEQCCKLILSTGFEANENDALLFVSGDSVEPSFTVKIVHFYSGKFCKKV